jgi:3-oxoacyl-[acyl-carrier protein] reductase
MKLDQLKIIVTGGAQGMGAHFVGRLVEGGATVVAGDVNEQGLANLPAGVHRRTLDVTSERDVADFVAWANEVTGGVNGLINNAGIIRDGLLVKKDRATGEVTTYGKDAWDAVLAVNLTGATMMTREVVAGMVRRDIRPGVVVNISSVARHGNRGQTAYVASKTSMAMNAVTWAREFAQFGIRVGAVAPGMIETPMTQGMNQKARETLVAAIPVGRIGVPEDIWLGVKFVLESEYFNARCLDLDGGLVM